MSIYDYDVDIIGPQITPPELRAPKFLAWLSVILSPIQWARDNFLGDYSTGSNYLPYDNLAQYSFGDVVVNTDRSVYMCVENNVVGIDPPNDSYWILINKKFIGIDEQLKYTSQIITFEYLLNKWFFITGSSPKIYITNNAPLFQPMLMGNSGQTSSTMANNSQYSQYFMANNPTYTFNDFTINIPIAVYNAQGTSPLSRENAIRNYADKFVLSGMTYTVVTY